MEQQISLKQLANDIKSWGNELGFAHIGIVEPNVENVNQQFRTWIAQKYHAEMHYMEKQLDLRLNPQTLIPNAKSIICCAMCYLPHGANPSTILNDANRAYISRYTLGRDYHKVLRKRLQQLATKISQQTNSCNYRCFTDSGPLLEKALALKTGIGWQGKNSLLINKNIGSWFFLGDIITDLALPPDNEISRNYCGNCDRCIRKCPTNAIVAPRVIDAQRCIAYLTLEHKGPIPTNLRSLMGNRICGCDDCQLNCPWNKAATTTRELDFLPRHNLDNIELVTLFDWTETQYLDNTAGSAIRRIGYECWQRNIAVALGNAPSSTQILNSLRSHLQQSSDLVKEHIEWAIQQQLHPTEKM